MPSGESVKTNCADNTVSYVYAGKEEKDFNDYISELNVCGMRQASANSIGNDITSATYKGAGKTVYVYYTRNTKTIHVLVRQGSSNVIEPPTSDVTEGSVAPKLAQMGINAESANGMGYVFTLADGSYLVYDGGETQADADRLYSYMSANNQRTDGRIVIAGWLLTHEHTDHYGAFKSFANSSYANDVTLEYIYANGFDPSSVNDKITSHEIFLSNPGGTAKIVELSKKFAGEPQIVKVHTGQSISVRNATVDILYTHEDLYSDTTVPAGVDANDLSTVSMVRIGGKKILMTGDAIDAAMTKLLAYYGNGDTLKCDVLQVPHHGLLGNLIKSGTLITEIGDDVAELIKPTIALCPTNSGPYNGDPSYYNSEFNKTIKEYTASYYFYCTTLVVDLNQMTVTVWSSES